MPRQLLAAAVLITCLVAHASAGQMLYATAALANRVDGFCLNDNGALAGTPLRQKDTVTNPRRLVIEGGVLYAAGESRVEAFAIEEGGRLRALGRTPGVEGANPRDIVVDLEHGEYGTLYVPQRQQDRIVAYPLNAEGGFQTEDFTSCVQGPIFSAWENMIRVDDRLYVTSNSGRGRVLVYRIGDDGQLPETDVANCTRLADVETEPISERRCLAGAGPILIDDGILYVAARYRRRILSFELASDGLFVPAVTIGTGGCKKLEQQDPSSKTAQQVRYLDMVRHDDTIFASFFEGGRVHAFPLANGALPKRARRKTKGSFVRTPVRLATGVSALGKPTLYVSGGQLNRIEAFRIQGAAMATTPFSRTDEMRRSFPNDLVVTTVSGACGD